MRKPVRKPTLNGTVQTATAGVITGQPEGKRTGTWPRNCELQLNQLCNNRAAFKRNRVTRVTGRGGNGKARELKNRAKKTNWGKRGSARQTQPCM